MTCECPLCNSASVISAGNVALDGLRHYWTSLGIDILHLIDESQSSLEVMKCYNCYLQFFHPVISGDSNFYEGLSRKNWYYDSHKWEFDFVLEQLAAMKKSAKLLEVGCGNGFFLEKAAGLVDNVEGVELNPRAIREAQKKGLKVSNSNLFDLTDKYDAIIAFQVLEHVEQPGKMVQKLVDCLSADGKLIIAVPNQDGFLGELKSNYLNMPPHHLTLWPRKTLEFMENKFGLRLLEYKKEPLTIDMYIAYRDDYFRRIQRKNGISDRIINKIQHVISNANVVADYHNAKKYLDGHSHVAIFEKK